MRHGAVIATAMFFGPLPVQAMAEPVIALASAETLLEVEAEGIARAVPDVATFNVAVTADGAVPSAALRANAVLADHLMAAVRHVGIADSEMRTESVRVMPRYRQERGEDTDQVIGSRATSRLSIRVLDIARSAALLSALTGAGATEIDGPAFSFADGARQSRVARKQAMVVAGAQADDYAAALNLRVSRVLRVSERARQSPGGSDIIVTGAHNTSGSLLPIVPGEQETRVTVWVDYALSR